MSDTDTNKESVHPGQPLEFELPFSQIPERLDKVLATLIPQHSRSRLQGWIEAGHVRVNGQPARVRQQVFPRDLIQVWPQVSAESQAFSPEAMELDIIAETANWIVLNKPAGLVTHPGAGNWQGTLLNGLLHRYPELTRVPRAGIVHRLDKDTSGILVVARHDKAQTDLVRQLQARTMRREYGALVHGHVRNSGETDQPIGRDRRVPVRMSINQPVAPKNALTYYDVVRRGVLGDGRTATELTCRLKTGRTHQIRVHMAGIGHPLLGDVLYGGTACEDYPRQMLHARTLGFTDYQTGQNLEFQAPWPDDFDVLRHKIIWSS